MITLEAALALIADLQKELKGLKGENEELRKENEKLRDENRNLSIILEERTTIPRVQIRKKPRENENKKSPGRPEGHEGASRPMPDKVDEVKEVKLENNVCPDCGHRVSHLRHRERIIEDIIPAKIKVTKILVHEYYCKHCKKNVEAPVTDAFPNCRFGLSLYLFVVFLSKKERLTHNRIVELLKIFGIKLSEGEISNILVRTATEFKDKYKELIKELQQSPYVNADETSWSVNGENHYLWGFISKGIALYHIDKTRSQKVAKRFLGEDYRGVLITDFYSAYTSLPCPKQKCLVHLFRELKESAEGKTSESDFKKFKDDVEKVIRSAIDFSAEEQDTIERARIKYECEAKIDGIIKRKWNDEDAQRLVKRLKSHKDSLFTFLLYPNIKYHNNDAEIALRSNVVIRKISYGNKSDTGAAAHSVIMTVMETCGLRNQNFLDWSHEYLEERLRN